MFTHLKLAKDLDCFSEEEYKYFFDEYKIVVK